jgi:uncharacterized protein YihD (DUF1040 family)
MRDPNRIDRIIDKLRRYWREHPDLRLGQIVVNMNKTLSDPFHVEDDVLERAIDRALTKDGGR